MYLEIEMDMAATIEYDFVEQPREEFFCPVTFTVLLEPYLTQCCGNHLSQEAYQRLQGQPCPVCREENLMAVIDKSVKRKVLSLKVRCPHKAEGCEWQGELGSLKQHLNTNSSVPRGVCRYVDVDCPYACGERVQRRSLKEHISQHCPLRPFTCQYCNHEATYQEVTKDHWPVCEKYPLPCPNECGEKRIERQHLKKHLEQTCPLEKVPESVKTVQQQEDQIKQQDTYSSTLKSNTNMEASSSLDDSQRLFEEAMKEGYVTSKITKMILCGPAGSGKTSFKNLLIGEPSPSTRVSTPLAVRPVALYRYNGELQNLSFQERKAYLVKAIMAHTLKLKSSFGEDNPASATKEVISSVSISSDESDEEEDDLLQSITTDEELVALIDKSSGSKPIAFYRILQIIDSGGQPQFYQILPIFLRQLSYFVFVFKLSEELAGHTTVELYDECGNAIGKPFTSPHSNEQLLQHCLRTLQSHKSMLDGECAQILILGTHKDKVCECKTETQEEKNEKLKSLLLPAFEKDVVCSGIGWRPIFAVNATSHAEEDKKVAEEVRQLVMKDTSTKPAEIPLRWYALELLLEEMTHNLGRGVLSWKECLAAASSKLHFDEESLRAALVFLDGLSEVFHYKDILPNIIFANPQVLLDKASELVKAKYRLEKRSAEGCTLITEEWQRFHGNALVSLDFLSQEEFKKEYVPRVFSPTDLIKLFKHLLIFADFTDGMLFMPALLQDIEEERIESYRKSFSSPLPPLVVEFPHKAPLLGVFCALTCFLLNDHFPDPWYLSKSSDRFSPSCLYHNCIQFDIPKYCASVLLIESFNRFECHISLSDVAFFHCSKRLCSFIVRVLDKGLLEANATLGYSSSQHSIKLLCPRDNGRSHGATVGYGMWRCSVNVQSCGELTANQNIWLEFLTKQDGDSLPLTQSDMAVKYGVTDQQLDTMISNDHINAVSLFLVKWEDVANHLNINRLEIDDIRQTPGISAVTRNRKALVAWKTAIFRAATYRRLVGALDKLEEVECADKVCELIR